uniref:Phosphatidylserine synthase n=1 Tax=Ditylenchus dipsaci TaxID=166011 RepID=A0A915CQR2_9BILA
MAYRRIRSRSSPPETRMSTAGRSESDNYTGEEGTTDEFEDVVEETRRQRRRSLRKRTATELERLHFRLVNEKVVNDITLERLAAMKTSQSKHFPRAMAFPNGPFIRPHPTFWRIIFGVSVLYALLLQFTLYQSYGDIKRVISWLDPVGLSQTSLDEKDYAINCSDVSLERIWSHIDIFAVGHFLGWGMKALLIRHTIICWYISIAWELTEVVFAHLLPNFQECWWDAIFLDIIICNGLGILFGLWLCRYMEMRSFHWESIKNIRTARGKFKRAVLQFTPESWMKVEWLNIFPLKRCLAIYAFIMITELNTFFLKHVFSIDTKHPIVFWRIILIGLISAPSIRQYYVYATDPKLPDIKVKLVSLWILFCAVGTVFCVWLSVVWAKYSSMTKNVEMEGGETRQCYLDSSCENLGAIKEDVLRRRRLLNIPSPDFS